MQDTTALSAQLNKWRVIALRMIRAGRALQGLALLDAVSRLELRWAFTSAQQPAQQKSGVGR
jgi:hypothetical protein